MALYDCRGRVKEIVANLFRVLFFFRLGQPRPVYSWGVCICVCVCVCVCDSFLEAAPRKSGRGKRVGTVHDTFQSPGA